MSSSASYHVEESSGPSVNENWASPSELLEMRTMWSAIVAQHKSEVAALQSALDRSHQQQQVYLKELQETQRLRSLYGSAASDQAKIVEERKVWTEERALLQQEIQRLRLSATETISSTDRSSSNASQGFKGELLRISQEENVALHEALARQAREKLELEQRLHFIQVTYSQRQRKLESQVQTMTVDNERSTKKQESLSSALHLLETQLDETHAKNASLDTELAKVQAELVNQVSAIEREKVVADTELADRLHSQKSKLMKSSSDREAALTAELRESDQARASLRDHVARLMATRGGELQAWQDRAESYENDIAELRMRLRQSEESKLIVTSSSNQLLLDAQEQIQCEANAKKELNSHKTTLLMRIDGLETQLGLLESDYGRITSENEHLHSHIEMLTAEATRWRDTDAVAATMRAAAEGLTDELQTQQQFYEKQIAQHVKAMELLQAKHGEDKKILLEMISKRKHQSSATQDRQADHATPQKKTRRHKGELAVDALQLMRTNALMAEQCANSIVKA